MTTVQGLNSRRDSAVVAQHSLEWLAQKKDKDLPPIDAARAIRQIMRVLGWSASRVAKQLNVSESWVSKLRTLLDLPAEVQSLVESRELEPSKAYLISKLADGDMIEFANEAVKRKWTRDEIEAEMRSRYSCLESDELRAPETVASADVREEVKHSGVKPFRLTVRQFERMIDAGVIPEGHDVELLGGILVDKMTKYEPHNFALARLGDDLRRLIGDDWAVREEKPVQLGNLWRPEPDLAVVRGPHERYGRQVPLAADIGIIIEASDTSYQKDRGLKWVRYAAAGVPAYWIVNIPAGVLEVYTDPSGRGRSAQYRETKTFVAGQQVPVILDGREIGQTPVRFFVT
jgi:Uma2 family endonuclease